MKPCQSAVSESDVARVSRADPYHRFHRSHEDLAVPDFTGASGIDDGRDGGIDFVVSDDRHDLRLRQEFNGELAAAITFHLTLLSAEAAFVTGATLPVDGGYASV